MVRHVHGADRPDGYRGLRDDNGSSPCVPLAATMTRIRLPGRWLLTMTLTWGFSGLAGAQTLVQFPSLDGPPATTLDAYLFKAEGTGQQPAVVFLHGCGGLIGRSGSISPRERQWAARLNADGLTVLMVDSFGPRHHGEMCSPASFDPAIYRARAFDAYAALLYLQSLDTVRPDRVGLIGWSEGGGTLLNTIRSGSKARPSGLPKGDFRAAVAFYPASCNRWAQGWNWASPTPLLVAVGESDVWTPAGPCRALIESASDGTTAAIQVYPGAFHDFDWPDMPVHEVPAFKTRAGVIPIEGMDPAALADARQRVPSFLKSLLSTP